MSFDLIPRLTIFNKADLVDRAAFQPLIDRHGGELLSVMAREDRERMRRLIEAKVHSD